MKKKITVYIVAKTDDAVALGEDKAKCVDGVYTAKEGVDVPGAPFTSKRQATEAVELLAKFDFEATVVTQKRTVTLA